MRSTWPATPVFTTSMVLWAPLGYLLLPSGPIPGKAKGLTWVWNIAKARQGECNCNSWSREIMYQSSYSCKTWVFIYVRVSLPPLYNQCLFKCTIKDACFISRSDGDTAVLNWLGSSSASQLDLQSELPLSSSVLPWSTQVAHQHRHLGRNRNAGHKMSYSGQKWVRKQLEVRVTQANGRPLVGIGATVP